YLVLRRLYLPLPYLSLILLAFTFPLLLSISIVLLIIYHRTSGLVGNDKIYEPFYRVPNIRVQEGESSGLGLGLYITRAIVEQHGGHMDIQSHPGEGSTFSIFLPPFTNETKVSHESTTKAPQLQAWTVGLSVQS